MRLSALILVLLRFHTVHFSMNSRYIGYFNVLDTDALVNTTEGLENHQSSIFDKVIQYGNQEEVVQQHVFTLAQLLLGSVKIKVHIQVLNELRNRITVSIGFL